MFPGGHMQPMANQPQLLSWLQEQQRPRRLRSIMEKERNKQFLKQAQEKGYLASPTEAMILTACREKDGSIYNLEDVQMVRLCGVHLRDVGATGECLNLRVCNLASNYIKSFEGLAACRRLVKLDLHGNQINQLPDEKFWSGMRELRMLYLHNNSISRLDYLQAMGAASNLQVLTLYDTPISLKMTYRHHVVNSVWSLKALDNHVISDEEIIEDAFFGGHFSMLHSSFHMNLVTPDKKDNSLDEELAQVRSVLQKVSRIQAKHSPVLIIQRFIRGWVTRRRFRIMARTKIWAVVTIQRFWRDCKGLEWKPAPKDAGIVAPPSTAVLTTVARKLSASPPQTLKTSSPGAAMSASVTEGSSTGMDYDTYLRNRRPGSKSPSLVSAMAIERPHPLAEDVQHARLVEEHETSGSPTRVGTGTRRQTTFFVKLLPSDDELPYEDILPENARPGLFRSMGQDFKKPSKPKEVKKAKKKHRTVGSMLGTLSDGELQRNRSSDENSEDEELSTVKFRLMGLVPASHKLDPLQDLLISRREAGNDVRTGFQKYYTRKAATAKPVQKPVHKKPMNADQKLFARAQGTMGLSCLKAVLQAYRDRESSDVQGLKRDKVAAMREQRAEGKLRAKNFLDEKRHAALRKRDREISKISNEYKKHASREVEDMERRRDVRTKMVEMSNRSRKENDFSHDFSSQHTSISNALLRHDRQARNEKLSVNKVDFVQTEREHETSQRNLVKRYLEHRQLMRQAQVAVEKAALDTRMIQEANDRLMEARENISRQKEKAKQLHAFYPLPKCATHPVLPPVKREGKPDQWNTLISMYEGRIGNHPAMIGST
ncbi:uncharacterized protein [Diadema antillarum]|uniref:uncharacterized protein n=1 Tax=Diadema antillarum TaxID=105358 RepID=UPI003A8AA241